jgi:hypothetical protein
MRMQYRAFAEEKSTNTINIKAPVSLIPKQGVI